MVNLTDSIYKKIWSLFSSDVWKYSDPYMRILRTEVFHQLFTEFWVKLKDIIK